MLPTRAARWRQIAGIFALFSRSPSRIKHAAADCVLSNDVGVKRRAQLGSTRERFVVHMKDAKALGESTRPLEIIEQAPEEIAFQRHAFKDRAVHVNEMLLKI